MRKLFVLFAIMLVLAVSCEKDRNNEKDTVDLVNEEIYEIMKDVYLWYTHIPNLDPTSYNSPYDLLDNLRYTVYDKWSHLFTVDEFEEYFEQGIMVGYGFLPGLDEGENIRVAFVYKSTEMYNKGVRRGWIIKKINGTAVTPENYGDLIGPATIGLQRNFEFLNGDGATVSLTITKSEVHLTPVLHYEVISAGGKDIGYMVFQDFIDAGIPEIDEAFDAFNAAGIDEIIIDLRYNGGGSTEVAEHLAGWLIGKNNGGDPFVNFRFNKRYSFLDTTFNVPDNTDGISVSRIFYIGTRNTASASELMINGTKPYVTSVLAGDTTHGKPVGMHSLYLEQDDYVLLPITFRYTNAEEEGEFYDGLPPQMPVNDDLTEDFGSPDEDILASILAYITGGVPLKSAPGRESKILTDDKPINEFLKAY